MVLELGLAQNKGKALKKKFGNRASKCEWGEAVFTGTTSINYVKNTATEWESRKKKQEQKKNL